MCGFFFSKRELALIAAGAVVLSPLLLVGAAVYGAGVGIKAGAKAANRAHERRLLRHLNRANTSTASPIQQLWDAGRFSQDVFQRWRLAFALMAVGDLRAAHLQFTAAVNGQRSLTAKYFVPALYFLAMCEVRSQQWQMAITHLERALSKLQVSQTTEGGDATGHVTDEGATELSITVADLQGLLAFALVANAARAEVLDTASAEKAAGLAERAATLDPSNARHFATQGWALFLLGLRVHPDDGKTVTTDATLLQKALYAVQRARKVAADSERDAHAAIVAQFGDKATAALAATVTDEGVVVVGTVVDHKPVPGERPDDDTGSDDEEGTADAPLEAFATGQGAGGISIAELYSLQAQIHLALGDAEAAAAALAAARSIDVGVPHAGLSADPDVGDPRIGLLRPWPLFAIDTGAGLNNHTFVEAKLRKPTWCDYCMNFIPSTNCMRCTACGYTVHRPTSDCDCVEVAKNKECVCAREGDDVSDATPVTNHQHVLRFRRVHTSHDCVHCGKSILFMTRALECNVCRCFAHDKCAPLMTNAVVDRPNEGSAKYALRRW